MSFADAFELPFVRKVTSIADGNAVTKEYTITPLTTRDLLPWLNEVALARRAEYTRLMPANLKPRERWDAERWIALQEATPDDLIPLVGTGPGTIKVLELLAKKAGLKDDADIAAFVDGASPRQNLRDAYRGSGLIDADTYALWFIPKLPDPPANDNATDKTVTPPNVSSPAGNSGA